MRLEEKPARLIVVRNLEDSKFGGIRFAFVNYEHRVVVMGMPSNRGTTFMVLEMESPRAPYILRPDLQGTLPVSWEPFGTYGKPPADPPAKVGTAYGALLFHPGLGLMMSLHLWGPGGEADYVLPVRRRPLGKGRATSPSDWNEFRSSGTIGIGRTVQISGCSVLPYDKNLQLVGRGGTNTQLELPSPPVSSTVRKLGQSCGLHINSGRSMMLHCLEDSSELGDDTTKLYVFDKIAGRWHVVTVPGQDPFVRSIGKYLLGIARTPRTEKQHGRISAGLAEFEQLTKNASREVKPFPWGPHSEAYYPGILFAIDVETGKLFQWRTNQADSEILWADDAAFYYRRANELLKVEIVQGASGPVIGPVSSILKADILFDVHAAFRGK